MTKSGRLGSPSVLIQRHFCETIPSSACLCRFVKQDIKTDVGVINLIVTGHFKDRKSVKQVMWPTVKTPQKKISSYLPEFFSFQFMSVSHRYSLRVINCIYSFRQIK